MKKILRLLIIFSVCTQMFLISAFANEDDAWEEALKNAFVGKESVLLPEGVTKSIGTSGSVDRGRYISSSAVGISNEGYGKIGVYADTLAHVNVKKIQMNVYLDRWDEENRDWEQVKMFKYVYTPAAGETLNSASESFTISDQPAGYYYRLRGIHGVWAYTGEVETHSSVTDGIMIKNGPA